MGLCDGNGGKVGKEEEGSGIGLREVFPGTLPLVFVFLYNESPVQRYRITRLSIHPSLLLTQRRSSQLYILDHPCRAEVPTSNTQWANIETWNKVVGQH